MKVIKSFDQFLKEEFNCPSGEMDMLLEEMSVALEGMEILLEELDIKRMAKGAWEAAKQKMAEFALKFLEYASGIVGKMKDIGSKIWLGAWSLAEKLFAMLGKIWGKIKSIEKSNPILFKSIVVLVLIILLMVVFSGNAYAQKTGNPPPIGTIDAAIGFLQHLRESPNEHSGISLSKAMAYLIELKKGHVIKVDHESEAMAKSALEVVKGMVEEAKGSKDAGMVKRLNSLADVGAKYVGYVIEESSYKHATGFGSETSISFSKK